MAKKTRRPAKRSPKKPSPKKRSPSHVPTQGLYGSITHTELASADPVATKAWCAKVLGWAFKPSFPIPGGGDYHLFAYSDKGGGGIRKINPSEPPGSSFSVRSEERRVGKSVDLGGRRIIKKKKATIK